MRTFGHHVIVILLSTLLMLPSDLRAQMDGVSLDQKPHPCAEIKSRMFEDAQSLEPTAPTPNQLAYDARFYDLDLSLSPTTATLTGTVSMSALVTFGPLLMVDLDLYNSMVVDAVSANGVTTTFTRVGNVLTVILNRSHMAGEEFTVAVQYHGTPTGDSFGFDTHNSDAMIWTLSQPFGARTWWPCKDHPSDKADSVDIRVTVPSGLVTASNGTNISSTDNGTVTVSHWQVRYPIATYLVSLAIHPYLTYSDWYAFAPSDSMEIQFYMFPDTLVGTRMNNAKIKTMLEAFADQFGEYPFIEEKYGQAHYTTGGGMEHQTCSSLSSFLSEVLNAHELGHQWWGDMITCRSFNHIWLNEGFATYAEALWAEASQGSSAYQASMAAKKYTGPGTIYVSDETNESLVFHTGRSYHKASWVLHMLRHVLGDSLFTAALAEYRSAHAFGTAVTEDFQHACETVSGKDLTRFFQQWIYGERYPQYRFGWLSRVVTGGYEVIIRIEQIQSWQLFSMPIDVQVTTDSGTYTFTALDSLPEQVFSFFVPVSPTAVELDPDEWILRTLESNQSAVAEPDIQVGPEISVASPNPFHRTTKLQFWLPVATDVRAMIFNAQGKLVCRLFDGRRQAGFQEVNWSGVDDQGRQLPAGIYWAAIDALGSRLTRKLVRMR